MKHNHFRMFAILAGLLVCGGAAWGVYHFSQVSSEGHFTPAAFAPPLAQVADRVQIYIGGEPLLGEVAAQRLVLKTKDTEAPVAATEIVASVNDTDRVRYARVPLMLGLAAAAGGGLVLFLVGLFTPLIKALKPPEIVDLHLEA